LYRLGLYNQDVITIHKCLRCGHEWPSRLERLPKVCPKCNSPYWNKTKWKGVGKMDQNLFNCLWGILKRLSEDCENAIKPNHCVLELTKGGTAYRFRIPEAPRRHVVAWGHLRPGGSKKRGINEPCVTVGVYAGSLDVKKPPFSNYYCPTGNYGPKGKGEVQAAICGVGDKSYKVILKALIQASEAALW